MGGGLGAIVDVEFGQYRAHVAATDSNPPTIHQIALGIVDNVPLAYQSGSPGASATATHDGDN